MSAFPTSASGQNFISYPAGPTPVGTTLTANASNNTKATSFTQFVASSPFACTFLTITVPNTTGAAGRLFLFDVATGAAASEVVVIANLPTEGTSASSSVYGTSTYSIPMAIATATRISARCQCSTGASTMTLQIGIGTVNGVPGLTSVTTYGADTSDSGGAQVDPGGSANTKGAYTELSASLSANLQWAGLAMSCGRGTYTNAFWLIDLATGAAASEVVLVPDLFVAVASNAGAQSTLQPRMIPLPMFIASGTRVAGRASSSTATATVRLLDLILLAGTAPSESAGSGVSRSRVVNA